MNKLFSGAYPGGVGRAPLGLERKLPHLDLYTQRLSRLKNPAYADDTLRFRVHKQGGGSRFALKCPPVVSNSHKMNFLLNDVCALVTPLFGLGKVFPAPNTLFAATDLW